VLRVWPASEVTEDLVRAVHHLLPQLSGSARLPSGLEVDQIVSSQATTLLLASDGEMGEGDGPIVGMLTLVTFRLPTGVRAWVEDVVVDSGSRGRGVGEALTQAAIEGSGCRPNFSRLSQPVCQGRVHSPDRGGLRQCAEHTAVGAKQR